MKRPFFFLGTGMLAGCFLFLFLGPAFLLPLLAFFFPLAILFLFRKRDLFRKLAAFFGAAFLAVCFTFLSLGPQLTFSQNLKTEEKITVSFTAVAELETSGSSRGYRVYLQKMGEVTMKPISIAIYCNKSLPMFEEVTAPVSFFRQKSLWNTLTQTDGCFASAYLALYEDSDLSCKPSDKQYSLYRLTHSLRNAVKTAFEENFNAPYNGILFGTATGDTSLIEASDLRLFRKAGIAHLFAVSGLHLSIITTILLQFLNRKRASATITLLATLPLILGMTLLAGFSPSILRAAGMQLLLLVGMLLGRKYDAPGALGFVIFLMLLCSPTLVANAGFLLSVSASGGILLFAEPISKRLIRFCKAEKPALISLLRTLAVSLSASFAVLPFSIFFFDTFSLIAPITNLFAGLLAPFCVVLSLILAVLTVLGAPEAILSLVAVPAEFSAFCLQKIGHFFASLPLALSFESFDLLRILIFPVLAILLFLALQKRPFKQLLAFTLAGILLVLSIASLLQLRANSEDRILIQVDEKNCQILLSSKGENALYLSSMVPGNRTRMIEEIRKRDATDLDLVTVWNPDAKTTLSLDLLTNDYPIRHLISDQFYIFSVDKQDDLTNHSATIGDLNLTFFDYLGENALLICDNATKILIVTEEMNCSYLAKQPLFPQKIDFFIALSGPPKEIEAISYQNLILCQTKESPQFLTDCRLLSEGAIYITLFGDQIRYDITSDVPSSDATENS